jgi:hypothetical protein
MIQMGVQPLSAAFTEGRPPEPDQAVGASPASKAGWPTTLRDSSRTAPCSCPRRPSRFPGSSRPLTHPFLVSGPVAPRLTTSGLLVPAEPQEL